MENEDYASDSDQSDEDYCPLKEKNELLSEEESGDESAADTDNEGAPPPKKTAYNNKTTSAATTTARKRKSTAIKEETPKSSVDPEEPIGDDKSHADALWASFLGDTESASGKPTSQPAIKKVIITETVEFAGEQIEVRKEVVVKKESDLFAIASTAEDDARPEAKSPLVNGLRTVGSLRKPIGAVATKSGGGLGSVLGQLGKKTKISVLEKSALDWKSFKHSQGIDEQLQTHNKGKDGYLERQDFLQRTDVRQFEIEKDLRQAKRNHR